MKAKYTPGPWFTPPEYRDCPDPWWSVDARRTSETVTGIALVSTSYADACLIAAAPDLLAACEMLQEIIESRAAISEEAYLVLVEAIVKAKGE